MSKINTYPIELALAAAVAAFEKNQHRVERDFIRTESSSIVPNRVLMQQYLAGADPELGIMPAHHEKAEHIINYLQQANLMQTLSTGRTNRFLGDIAELLTTLKINERDFGLLAWAPKLTTDNENRDRVREASSHYEFRSHWIGKLNEKVTLNFTLLESKYVSKMNCYSVYGHDDAGSLITYWANNEKKIVKHGALQGRVKAHNRDSYRSNACVTTLNYVKVL